jgi:uncharacterized protein (TIGR01777 family)
VKILVTGSHGFIAHALIPSLESGGHSIRRLVRSSADTGRGEFAWDPYRKQIDDAALDGIDAVVHLAGESIAEGRWTPDKKKRILESRTIPTRFLAEKIAASTSPPSVFVCASAIGYYGDRGEEVLTEGSSPGSDFLANVCLEWEAATAPASANKARVVNVRFGLILSPDGGALQKILMPFKLGVGGRLGSGNQYWSWIALDDVIGAIGHVLTAQSVQGPVNITGPNAVTNKEFTSVLGKVIHRPALFPAPAVALRIALGEMADALLLSSANVRPEKLSVSNYRFRHTDLAEALTYLLQ